MTDVDALVTAATHRTGNGPGCYICQLSGQDDDLGKFLRILEQREAAAEKAVVRVKVRAILKDSFGVEVSDGQVGEHFRNSSGKHWERP